MYLLNEIKQCPYSMTFEFYSGEKYTITYFKLTFLANFSLKSLGVLQVFFVALGDQIMPRCPAVNCDEIEVPSENHCLIPSDVSLISKIFDSIIEGNVFDIPILMYTSFNLMSAGRKSSGGFPLAPQISLPLTIASVLLNPNCECLLMFSRRDC